MALIPIKRSRTSKPPIGTPIDWSNPLTAGLAGAWAFNEGTGATAFSPTGNNASFLLPVWDTNGLFFSRVAGNYGTATATPNSEYTVFSIQTHDGASSIRSMVDQDDGASNRIFQHRIDATHRAEGIAFNTGGSAFVVTHDTALPAQKEFKQCTVASKTAVSVTVNGITKSTAVTGTLRGMVSAIPLYFGRRVTISQPYGRNREE
jgi:hypothetical protein